MAKESLFLCLCQQKSLIFGFCCCFKLDLPSFWGTMTSFDQKMLTQQGLVPWLRKSRDQRVAVSRKHGAARLELQRSSRTSTPFFSRGDGRVLSDFRWLLVIWFMKAESNLFCSTRIFFGVEGVLQQANNYSLLLVIIVIQKLAQMILTPQLVGFQTITHLHTRDIGSFLLSEVDPWLYVYIHHKPNR